MDNIKNISKVWVSSLNFLDNYIVNAVIIIILFLYTSNIFTNINSFVGNLYNFSVVRLIVLLLIIYISPKSPTIGILLAISYILSVQYSNNETFVSKNTSEEEHHLLDVMQEHNSLKHMKEKDMMYDTKVKNLYNDANTVESFFPFNDSKNSFEHNVEQNNKNNCLDTYIPHHESVGNVCDPTATFQNELNAQGLNSPEGFNSPDVGSPL